MLNRKRGEDLMANFVISGFSDEMDRDLQVQIRELKRMGIDRMEMRFLYGKNSVDYSLADMKEMKKQLEALEERLQNA